MLSKKMTIVACAALTFAMVNVRPAVAQVEPMDARTEFTFNAPVELPGATLPPGTYVFRFADGSMLRRVIQVSPKNDPSKTYGMFLTISAERPKATDTAELRFLETPAGTPAAVKTWWYPGRTIGREFIYSKEQARRLAKATNSSVLTTKAETVPSGQLATADLAYVSPSGEETAVSETATASAAPIDRAPVQESTSASNAPRQSLPRTNTMLPLIALMGLGSLVGGTSLRRFRQ